MSTGNNGAKIRLAVLLVVLAAVAAAGWYRLSGRGFGGSGASGVETTVINGDLTGKTLEEVTAALGAQPVEQPNPDAERLTAKIYLYTLPSSNPERQFVRVRVAANGKVLYTRYVDAAGNEVNVDSQR